MACEDILLHTNGQKVRVRAWSTLATIVVAIGACTVPEPPNAVWVTVPEAASVDAVAESLAVHGIVRSAESFARYARLGNKDEGIQPGTYPFRPGTPMGRVLIQLRKGRPPVQRLRVKAGHWITEVAEAVEDRFGIPAESLVVAAGDSTLRARVGARGASLEGYLFPTTYYVKLPTSAHDIVRQMVDSFETRWNVEWNARLDSLGLTRDEAVTLASVIEGELVHGGDRPEIASVYHNRLTRGMRLQADPTVVYALGKRRRLYQGDYKVKSPYNTYRINGLPPAPINQPSLASLEAALYPPESEYLYFVARRDGLHEFSRSYREHLATIRQVRARGRRGPQAGK